MGFVDKQNNVEADLTPTPKGKQMKKEETMENPNEDDPDFKCIVHDVSGIKDKD